MTGEGRAFLPYGRQVIEDDDVAAVVAVLTGDTLTTGPKVGEFERRLAETVGAPHAVVVANGTAALHLACMAAGLGPGDVAVVPAVTFLATANAARFVGAEVVFADVDPDTGLVTADTLHAALARAGGRARAVLPVHLNGQCVAMEEVAEVAAEAGLAVIEDACHALGSTLGGSPAGSCRHAAMTAFSFHPVKTVAMGEGGAITCRDDRLAEHLRRLRSHGIVREPAGFTHADLAFDADGAANPWYYEMPEIGFNYRASDIACALGLSQLNKLPRFAERRRHLAARYDALLEPLAPVLRPIGRLPGQQPVWHLYSVLIDFDAAGIDRAHLMHALRASGIGTQVHYLPVSEQPYYRARYGRTALPGAMAYYRRQLSLPLFPAMTDEDVGTVCATLARLLRGAP